MSLPRSKSSPACADNSRLPFILLASDFLQQLRTDYQVQSANQQEGQQIMERKIIVIALAVFAFGFGSAIRSNGGTEVIEPYRAPAPRYNYAPPPPPPRPIFFAPPLPVFGVVIGPRYGYYGRGYGYYGRGYYGAHRFYGRHPYWRSHHHSR